MVTDRVMQKTMEQSWTKYFNNPTGDGQVGFLRPLLLLVGVAYFVYACSFWSGWTMDDFPVIVDNPDIRSLAGFFADSRPGRPLREVTFLLDYQFFGLNPAGYRIQNILWHGLNAWLLWCLAIRLRQSLLVAWGAALLFLVHPVTVEVVANSSHRKDSLALAFSLIAFLTYTRFADRVPRKWWYLAGAAVSWLLACAAKQNAVVTPLLWLAYEVAFVPRDQRFLLRYPRLLTAAGATVLLGGGIAWFVLADGAQRLADAIRGPLAKMNQVNNWTLDGYYQAVLKAWAFMTGKVVWPLELGVEYTFSLPNGWFDPWVIAGFALAAGTMVLLLTLPHRSPAGFLAIAWFAAFWLPTANLWPLAYLAADRYLYAPLAGVCLVAALLLEKLSANVGKLPALLLLGAVVVTGSVLSWRQIPTWHNEEALWLQAYRVSPTSAFALNNLGNIALGRGDQTEALRFYEESFRSNPYNPTSNYNLGFLYRIVGNLPAARRHLQIFLEIANPREYVRERLAAEKALGSLAVPDSDRRLP